jgi:hypothetical protein
LKLQFFTSWFWESQASQSCFLEASNSLLLLQNSQKLRDFFGSGLCYAGCVFSIALPFIFIPCNNSKRCFVGWKRITVNYLPHPA